VEPFPLSLEEYPQWLAAQSRSSGDECGQEVRQSASARKQLKREQAEQRKRLQPLRHKVSRAEQALESAQADKGRIEAQLADNALYSEENRQRLQSLLLEKAELERRCRQLEEQWLEASEALEAMQPAD
jgi:ATP-binding cassette subfamily F protein 3